MSRTNLVFNFGFLLEAPAGTSTEVEFDYPKIKIDDTVFQPLQGRFKATRTREGVYIAGDFATDIVTECVRCLDDFECHVQAHADELFYFPPSLAPEGEYVMREDGNIDLGPLVRELTLLGLPMQPICRPDCRGLCSKCGQNLNEGTCDCKHDDIDPRLAALKVLLEKSGE